MDGFAKIYGGKDFALGYLTLADFHIAELSYYIEKLCPEVYAKYGFLNRVRTSLEALPSIKKYYAEGSSMKAPFMPGDSVISF